MTDGLWAQIGCELRGTSVILSYRDALGREHDGQAIGTFDAATRNVFVLPQFHRLPALHADLQRVSDEASATVPVFVESERSYADVDWEEMLVRALDPLEGIGVAFVRAQRSGTVVPLPTNRWLALADGVDENLNVANLGWDVVNLEEGSSRRGMSAGVEVIRAADLAVELRRLELVEAGKRPNLVIPYGMSAREIARACVVPEGVAVMAIDTDQPVVPVRDVLEGIEAGRIIDIAGRDDHLLAADPGSLVGLNALAMPSLGQTWATAWLGTAPAEGRGGRQLDAELRPVDAGGTIGDALAVGAVVVSGARYRLGVQIGRAYDRTVLTVAPPPIEEALPMLSAAIDLEVGVFGDGFRVEGFNTQPLHLPTSGPTNEVSFIVVAPVVESPTQASFDLSLRYQGNVAQQFKLTATVFPEGAVGRGDLRLALTFRRIASDESGALGKRALSITTETCADGAQRVLVWGPGTDHRELNPFQINNFVTDFHTILEEAFWLGDQPRWDATYPVGPPSADFEDTIRKLAVLGSNFANAVLTHLPSQNQPRLYDLAQHEGEVIQIIREDGVEALPWAALYDWEVPSREDAPVCLGDHVGRHHDSGAVCVKGFWGVRHIVEEVLQSPHNRANPPYERPGKPDEVLVSLDEENTFTRQVVDALCEGSGLSVRPFTGDSDTLIDRLWASDPRVSIAVLLGHVEVKQSAGRLGSGSLALLGDNYLSTGALPARFFRDGTWTPPPGPLAMVLGCTTGPEDIGAATSLVSDFLDAGSPWVVGTAAPITDAMASDLGRTLIAALFESESVGHAMRAWRHTVLQAGNPLAFACAAVGDVDTGFAPALSA